MWTFNLLVSLLLRTVVFHPCIIWKIRNMLSQKANEKLDRASVVPHHQVISLKSLQLITKSIAGVLSMIVGRDHISKVLV